MRTSIIIDDSMKDKWWDIKKEAARLNMKISEYIVFCHEIRKKNETKDKLLEILGNPLENGAKNIDAIAASKNTWKT
ncbi:MAG: hypothetical protein JW891_18640 [Candidatus Lokiarchaeota archaeon]|nr:hypothetical protein [Candidatus Lokiarchaeota archaeon]